MPNVPNIVMIVIDSARSDLLSCYGQSLHTSPAVDKLAAKGILFECAIAPSAWTFPSVASVFTGMLPTKHGGHDQHRVLDSDYHTIAEVLSEHGYQTAAFSDLPFVGPTTKLDRGYQVMSNLRGSEVTLASKVDKAIGRTKRSVTGQYQKSHESRVLFREVSRWLDKERSQSDPFFLYIQSDEVHAPYMPPRRYLKQFTSEDGKKIRSINQDKVLYVSGKVSMTNQDFDTLFRLACAEMRHLDNYIGKLIGHLEAIGVLDNTYVIITADHGDNFGEHGLMRHGLCLYDTLIKVPLILTGPHIKGTQRVQSMVQLIDLFPTILRLAGIEEPLIEAECQGHDLLESISSGQFSPFAVSELYRPAPGQYERGAPEFMDTFRHKYDRVLRSYRTLTHKFIWSSNGRHELYDLVNDPGENNNLIELELDLASQMQHQLDEWLDSFEHADVVLSQSDDQVQDQAVIQRLKDLGYI